MAACSVSDQGPGGPVTAARIEVVPARDTIESFTQRELQIRVHDSRGQLLPDAEFTTTSSNPARVQVNGPTISGQEWTTPQGTQPVDSAVITVQSGSAVARVPIVLLPQIAELRLQGAPQFIRSGRTVDFAPFIVTPRSGSFGTAELPVALFEWESSDAGVLTVAAGVVTPTGTGTVELRVSYREHAVTLPVRVGEALYDVVDVGASLAEPFHASHMNDSAEVVGTHFFGGASTGFHWRAGAVRNLDGCVTGRSAPPRINTAGQVMCRIEDGAGGLVPGYWRDGQVTAIAGGDTAFQPVAINDSGDVVGGMRFLSNGVMTSIPTKPLASTPAAIDLNNRRQVLVEGYNVSASGSATAYVWNATDGTTSELMSNGRYGGFTRMNDLGAVVGTAGSPGQLPTFETSEDINNAGQIVGADNGRGFVKIDGMKYILDYTVDADVAFMRGIVINERGQILAHGTLRPSGRVSYFLLTPRQAPAIGASMVP